MRQGDAVVVSEADQIGAADPSQKTTGVLQVGMLDTKVSGRCEGNSLISNLRC